MTQHLRPTPADQSRGPPLGATPEELRRAIDLVATLRARVIRIGFFGTLLYRPDPAGPGTPEAVMQQLDILRTEVALVRTVCNALTSNTGLPDTSAGVSHWIHRIAKRSAKKLARIVQIADLSEMVLIAIEQRNPIAGKHLNAHMVNARSGFYEVVTELCEGFWDDIAESHVEELDKATNAAKLLADRLIRLEHIGKHVRLVSLNASVEAARAGDVGKGLMVIAHEFKFLAEEIQSLAKEARDDVAGLS